MNVLNKVLAFLGMIIKLITWLVANGVPFLRELIEEIKDLFQKDPDAKKGKPLGLRWIFKGIKK